jgi:hypothetical protein
VKETTPPANQGRILIGLEKRGGGLDANNRPVRLPAEAVRRMISRVIARLVLVRDGHRQPILKRKVHDREVEWTNQAKRVIAVRIRLERNRDKNSLDPRIVNRGKKGARKENNGRSSLAQKHATRHAKSATSKKNSVKNVSSKSSARDLEKVMSDA